METVKIPLALDCDDGVDESPCTAIGPMRCGDLTSDPSTLLPSSPSRTVDGRVVLIDLRTCDLTFKQVSDRIARFKEDPGYAGCEIFMDGDLYAIVAEPRGRVGRRLP